MGKIRLLTVLLFFVSHIVAAQDVTLPVGATEADVLYRSESTLGLTIHTKGWGLNYRSTTYKSAKLRTFYEGDLVSMRHAKEIKVAGSAFDNARSYVYGKLNNVWALRGGYGFQQVIFGKENPGAVEIRYSLSAGPSLGIAKPVYLVVLVPSARPDFMVQEDQKYDPDRHFPSNIVGRSSFGRGLSKTKIYPGVYLKGSMIFEYSPEADFVRAIEAGMLVDIYPKPIPIMAFNKSNPVMVSFFVNLMIGNKWY